MSAANPFVSNGTCYYASGQTLNTRFIPCGNVAFGQTWCCEGSDVCLTNRACYNAQFGVTYLAGCTDSTYSDPNCPGKGQNSNSPWAGLTFCNVQNASNPGICQQQGSNLVCPSGPADAWYACPDTGTTVSRPATCACPSSTKTVVFAAGITLNNVMSLPASTGGTISWAPGYGPSTVLATTSTPVTSSAISSAPTSSTTTSTPTSSSSTSTLTSTSASASASPTSSASSDSGLSSGAKIGIGVGVGVGASLIIIFFAFFMWYRRRHQRKPKIVEPEQDGTSGAVAGGAAVASNRNSKATSVKDADNRQSVFSGFKAELPAESEKGDYPPDNKHSPLLGNSSTMSQTGSTSELPGTPAPGAEDRLIGNGGREVAGRKGPVYEMPG